MSIVVLAGAGASAIGGAARLTRDMLANLPEYDGSHQRFERDQRILEAWAERRARGDVALEEWFSELQASDELRDVVLFNELAAFVAHVLGQDMAHRVRFRTQFQRLTHIASSTQIYEQEAMWSALRRLPSLVVITTNYDIVIERALRFTPTRMSPGFNYGEAGELLRGAPWFGRGKSGVLKGTVPIYKLHGSLSWERAPGLEVVKYIDCRPAITGKAFVVPPVREKPEPPRGLENVWSGAASALSCASRLIVIGYSAPEYDVAARALLANNFPQSAEVDVFDCYESVAETYRRILPGRTLRFHGKLLNALSSLEAIVNAVL